MPLWSSKPSPQSFCFKASVFTDQKRPDGSTLVRVVADRQFSGDVTIIESKVLEGKTPALYVNTERRLMGRKIAKLIKRNLNYDEYVKHFF